MQLELVGLAVLALGLGQAVVDSLLAVDDVLLQVVGHHPFYGLKTCTRISEAAQQFSFKQISERFDIFRNQ